MGRAYRFLLINDTTSKANAYLARKESDSYTINVDFSNNEEQGSYYPGIAYLAGQMSALVQQGATFQKCIFSTHGGEGMIKFGTDELTSYGWYSQFYNRTFYRLFPSPDTRVYFSGCQVAAGREGWQFLEAAARSLVRGAGGWAFGWTSDGWRFPFLDPHHFSGEVRAVSVSPGGGYLRYYDDWKVIVDGQGDPVRPY